MQHADGFKHILLPYVLLLHCLLLFAGKKLPIKRAIKYNNLTIDSFSFDLQYNTSGAHGLPPGVTDPKLAQYTVSGIKDAIKRWVELGALEIWQSLTTHDVMMQPAALAQPAEMHCQPVCHTTQLAPRHSQNVGQIRLRSLKQTSLT
jgi:hypothetical protein